MSSEENPEARPQVDFVSEVVVLTMPPALKRTHCAKAVFEISGGEQKAYHILLYIAMSHRKIPVFVLFFNSI